MATINIGTRSVEVPDTLDLGVSTCTKTQLSKLIENLKVGSRFVAWSPTSGLSTFKVARKRGDTFECALINGSHSITFGLDGRSLTRKDRAAYTIVYVKISENCLYTIDDYNEGLNSYRRDYPELGDA